MGLINDAAQDDGGGTTRTYVADMAGQLAAMAQDEGDETLAKALEVAAEIAKRPTTSTV